MSRTRVVVNPGALKAAILTDPAAAKALKDTAYAIKEAAEAIAPIETGYYQRRFAIRPWRDQWRIGNTDPFSHLVEFGSINNPIYAPLRMAAWSLGLRVQMHERPAS